MGWMTWERFGCNTGCQTDSDNCIGYVLLHAGKFLVTPCSTQITTIKITRPVVVAAAAAR